MPKLREVKKYKTKITYKSIFELEKIWENIFFSV